MCYTMKQYENRIKKLDAIQSEIDRLEREADAIKKDIQTDMGDAEHVDGENFRIHWVKVISARFNAKAFQAEHEALYNQYTRNTEYRRFTYSLQ